MLFRSLKGGGSFFGKKGKDHPASKRTGEKHHKSVPVSEIKTGLSFTNMAEAAKYFNINGGHISDVCRGKRNQTHGYKFCYAGHIGDNP